MKKDVVYVLHEFGSNSHYIALEHLLQQNNAIIKYREFSILKTIPKALKKGNFKLLKKQWVNFCFLLNLIFSKKKKIVVGIAPFDYKIDRLLFVLKNHMIFYHTSWTCWDKTFHPKKKKNTKATFEKWDFFLEKLVEHHFVVTNQAKNQLLENYQILESKISVVNHCISFPNIDFKEERKDKSYIFCGRLQPSKGIEEILRFFESNKQLSLTIVGKGALQSQVEKSAQQYPNINYKGFLKSRVKVLQEFKTHEYLILNSKKTKNWEELFGIVIIEAMSQGTIPIAANHSGPKEIISDEFGYLFLEGNLKETLMQISNEGRFNSEKSKKCVEVSQSYSIPNISKLWEPILIT